MSQYSINLSWKSLHQLYASSYKLCYNKEYISWFSDWGVEPVELFRNIYFTLEAQKSKLYIKVFKAGFDIREFNRIITEFPTIRLTNFINLRKALSQCTGEAVDIGHIKPPVEILITGDEMQASVYLNIAQSEIHRTGPVLIEEIKSVLQKNGVTEGLEDLSKKHLATQSEIVAARGIPPLHGSDAMVSYYELSDKKPIVKEDGSVNYFELNLIDNVKKGDWLGEKIPPTKGKCGMTVTGKQVPCKDGKDSALKFDKKTVGQYQENGRTVLRALLDGAVKFEGSNIKVDSHLIIPGDVGYETGNITFDGYVTINGIVKDGFSVIARHDITINGKLGIGAVGKIHSSEGSICIKGGIYGKNVAVIEAKRHVYVKYCNECNILAGEDINIGFYSLDSTLKAQKILLDPKYGKIIGGTIMADVKVVSGFIGNKFEKKTIISVHGFDRNAIRREFEDLLEKYKQHLQEANAVKRQIEVFEYNLSGAEYANMDEYNKYIRKYDEIVDEIKRLDEVRKKLQFTLQTKGEGEIGIFQAAYPETFLEIKKMQKRIHSIVNGSFYAENKELHHN
jgi:uncharacterized protein (DUF342 family)